MTDQSRKVYLATSGEYSDYRVLHVFTREEDAREYKLGEDVEERELHDGPVEVRVWHSLDWRSWTPEKQGSAYVVGNPDEEHELRDFDGREGHCEHHWERFPDRKALLTVSGWDLDRVRKVYSEQRAKYLAEKAGL